MNNTVYDIDFTRALPDPLKNDENMLALGRAIAGELQENIRLSRMAIIYARIDELDEGILDILARDLHVDWYEDTYPIAAKRQVIKDSVKVHKRLATRYAVVTALGSVFPHTEVQEWFEYGSTHHRFRIILDMTNANAPADFYQILRTMQYFKRLTAHLDEIIYQTSAVIEIRVETSLYRYRQGMTGRYESGTHPRRTTHGGVASAGIEVMPGGAGYSYQNPHTGTKPHRSTIAALRELEIITEDSGEGFTHRFGMTGQYAAGEKPHRNTGGGVAAGSVEVQAEFRRDSFRSPQAGTKPARNIEFINLSNDVSADTTAEAFLYAVNMTGKTTAGTEPRINTKPQTNAGGVIPAITAESFFYRARRCGTSKTKND